MDVFSNLLAVAVVSWLGALSPGPDFFLVFRNSLSFYTLIGIGVLLTESVLIYNIVKYVGAAYLFYIGITGVIASFKKSDEVNYACAASSQSITPWTAMKQGFLTNVLNPKAAFFFVSLFSQFIGVDTPLYIKVAYAATNWTVALIWFLFVSYVVTNPLFIKRLNQFRLYIDRVLGSALILLSIKLVLI
jgi:threonine/homoserine/homoserine lactone efflux protein